jgi:hypothetical protein
MRLINVKTLELEDFLGENVPKYAILSHTWGPDEVSFQDFALVRSCHSSQAAAAALVEERSGYKKILGCCAQAGRDGYPYVWVDTCCIDKTSSAELSEAINSMFDWYKSAAVCYALLSDVDVGPAAAPSHDDRDATIRRSRWFTRGWTLQEFLAPRDVVFYDAQWRRIAPKAELVELLSSVTGIACGFINGTNDIYTASIAQRMSWASKRQTTRVEDVAYCLLGIFDVHMPLLYGERDVAFLRLQEEICRRTEDHTYLAWGYQMPLDREYHGVFARSPAEFAGCAELTHDESQCLSGSGQFGPFAGLVQITNKGLLMPLAIFLDRYAQHADSVAVLPCCRRGNKSLSFPVDMDGKVENGVDVWRIPGGPPVLHPGSSWGFGDVWRQHSVTGFLKKSPSAKFWKSQSSPMPIEIRGLDSDQSPSPLCLVEVWPPYVWMPGRSRRPLSAPGQWRPDRVLLKVVLSGGLSTKDYLIVALDIVGSNPAGQDGEFQVSRIRPRVVPGDETRTKGEPYVSLAETRWCGAGRSLSRESLNEYTNEAELCGHLVSVEVSEGDCWVVDVRVGARSGGIEEAS